MKSNNCHTIIDCIPANNISSSWAFFKVVNRQLRIISVHFKLSAGKNDTAF